ncbi:hypothetical protein D3C81_2179590 [compost metagenome]
MLALFELADKVLQLAEFVWTNGLHQALQVTQPLKIKVMSVFSLELAYTLLQGLQAGRWRGEQRLLEHCAEQHGAITRAGSIAIEFEFG